MSSEGRKIIIDVDVERLIALFGEEARERPVETMSKALDLASNMQKYERNGTFYVLDPRAKKVVHLDGWGIEANPAIDNNVLSP